jgi:hypothetical protein
MSRIDSLNSWSADSNRPIVHPYMVKCLSDFNILYCLCLTIKMTRTSETY